MMPRDKTALITGAADLGNALARQLDQQGAHIVALAEASEGRRIRALRENSRRALAGPRYVQRRFMSGRRAVTFAHALRKHLGFILPH